MRASGGNWRDDVGLSPVRYDRDKRRTFGSHDKDSRYTPPTDTDPKKVSQRDEKCGGEVSGASNAGTGRRALLIGCTKYENLGKTRKLDGPANDVALMKALLVDKRFGFAEQDIVCLTEDDPERRPTRANIEREFDCLAKSANEGDQVFILLAGHGSRQPEANPPHPLHPEPDGEDEVFLPTDVSRAGPSKARIPGAIVDDEIGQWLKAITDKKAYVRRLRLLPLR